MSAPFNNNILKTFIVNHSFNAVVSRSLTENQRNELQSSDKIPELKSNYIILVMQSRCIFIRTGLRSAKIRAASYCSIIDNWITSLRFQ